MYLDANHDQWDEHLPLLMLGYRSLEHSALGYSPYFLMFGKEPRLPVEAELQVPVVSKSQTVTEYADKLRESLRIAHKHALQVSDASHGKNKRFYEKRMNEFDYKEGDLVFLHKAVVPKGQYYKFVRPWKAAVIVAKVGDLNYRIRVTGSRKTLLVHHNRLKPRTEPIVTPPVPDVAESRDGAGAEAVSPEAHAQTTPPAEMESVSVDSGSADGSAGATAWARLPINGTTAVQGKETVIEEPSSGTVQTAVPTRECPPVPPPSEIPPPVSARRSERRTRPPDRFVPGL